MIREKVRFVAGRQRINDSGASSSGDAFFEVKSYQPNNIRLDHNNKETKPADRRANEVVNQYSNKFKRLDKQYAADIVGNGENGIVGPFESAQKRFIGGQVIPLVVGPFGVMIGVFIVEIETVVGKEVALQPLAFVTVTV